MSQSSSSQFRGYMGGSPGEGFGGPPSDVHIGPEQRYGQHQPSNVYQGTAGQPSNVYQGTAAAAAQPSPYNLQSVTEGMDSMLPPSSASAGASTGPPAQPWVGSITKYATPPPQQQHHQQQQVPSPSTMTAPPPPQHSSTGSYAARSAMAHANTGTGGGSVAASMAPHANTGGGSVAAASTPPPPAAAAHHHSTASRYASADAIQAHQTRVLTDATRKVQEHAYYMKQAMDRDDLPTVLDRASHMMGELGDRHALSPKNYYELYMRALDDMPNLEEYFLGIQPVTFVYDATQYCPKVLPRLYLQICAASALIRSKEVQSVTEILKDLTQAVKCVQNPVRGLFLRHYLLQALRDKLPDGTDASGGSVEDAYNFVMDNFIEMNKLWVRLQHLPGDGKSKEQRKKREKERNELRILVGTNLVRLSQMEGVTSQVYGQVILPKILEQIVACGDPLSQAYLIDCIIQVFPDEYHIETLSILLAVCPKLRDKVNIRTILQSLMDRLANYYADEELLDEQDTNEVKKSLAMDSFTMFEECVQNVYNARGPKLTPKEVIRLQTALLNFSLKCYPGHMEQVNRCLGVCVASLRQASNAIPPEGTIVEVPTAPKLDEASTKELEKLLSIPLDTLALKVLKLNHYADLLACLPWENRRDVGMTMLNAIVTSGGEPPKSVEELEELFSIIAPVFREEHAVPKREHTARAADLMKGLGVSTQQESFGPTVPDEPVDVERAREMEQENNLVSKLVHMLDHEDTDVAYEMISAARNHLSMGGKARAGYTLVPIVFSGLRLADRIYAQEHPEPVEETPEEAVTNEPAGDGSQPEEKPEEEAKEADLSTEPAADVEKSEAQEGTEDIAVSEVENGTATDQDKKASDTDDTEDETKGDAAVDTPQVENVMEGADQTDVTAEPSTSESGAVDTQTVGQVSQNTEAQPEPKAEKSVSCRKVFVFLQKTIAMIAKANAELGIKLYLHTALAADNYAALCHQAEFGPITYELLSQGFVLYEEDIGDTKQQSRNIKPMIGTLLACQSLTKAEYENFTPKAAQYSAKLLKKSDQCQMVALCAHLFYRTGEGDVAGYQNPQRALECLQRALKLADASTTASASYVYLFVDLFDHYVYFFEKGNPSITEKYISGLAALIKEHLTTISPSATSDAVAINDAKAQYDEILRYIQKKKESESPEIAERFSLVQCDAKFT